MRGDEPVRCEPGRGKLGRRQPGPDEGGGGYSCGTDCVIVPPIATPPPVDSTTSLGPVMLPTTWLSTPLIAPGTAVQTTADVGVIPVTPACWASSRSPMPVTTPPAIATRPFPRPVVRIARSAIRTPITTTPIEMRPAGVSNGHRPVTLTQPCTWHTSVAAVTWYSPDPRRE